MAYEARHHRSCVREGIGSHHSLRKHRAMETLCKAEVV